MPLANNRILVVEDDFLIGLILTDMLTEAGGQVVGPFRTNVDALEHLGDLNGIDIALLDINLVGETSYPIASALRATHVPYMFLTSLNRGDMPAEHMRAGYLQKPFSQADLIAALLGCGFSTDR